MFESRINLLQNRNMSLQSTISTENNKIVVNPLQPGPIYINKNNKLTLLKSENDTLVFKKLAPKNCYKEDVIYESSEGDFSKGHPLTLINKLNLATNSSRTVAYYTDIATGRKQEKNSDEITKLIGQNNYDTLFSALCSVISQELRVRGILSLLTIPKILDNHNSQTDIQNRSNEDKCCQTEENCVDLFFKTKQRKRSKRSQLTTYVVKDIPKKKEKKVIVNPNSVIERQIVEEAEEIEATNNKIEADMLIELKPDFDEDSRGSLGNLSLSYDMDNSLLDRPHDLLKRIDQYTINKNESNSPQPQKTDLILIDGSKIELPVKPEDHFHLATPDVLKNLKNNEKMKVLWSQAYIDWKYCLVRDEDFNLPIHTAVLSDDVDLLRRQCLVLKNKNEGLDLIAGDATPLQMALTKTTPASVLCTTILLQYGADPLYTDEDDRTILHLAAEGTPEHLKAVISYCKANARQILHEQEELWKPEFEGRSNEWLAEYLLDYMCKVVDGQGYTPLMTASRQGAHLNVSQLVAASPRSVNMVMPNSGSTALYIAVGQACIDAAERGNKSKISENFSKTIGLLVSNGADATIKTHSGSDVNELLSEANISELSLLVSNKLTSVNFFNGQPLNDKNCDNYILEKDKDGKYQVKELDKKKSDLRSKRIERKKPVVKDKPIILENIPTTVIPAVYAKDLKALSPNDKLEKNNLQKYNATLQKYNVTLQNHFYMNKMSNIVQNDKNRKIKSSAVKNATIVPSFVKLRKGKHGKTDDEDDVLEVTPGSSVITTVITDDVSNSPVKRKSSTVQQIPKKRKTIPTDV